MKVKSLAAAALVLAHLPARAALVYHDSASTTGGEFSADFGISDLRNAGHTSPTDTENANLGGESYATTNPATGGFPVVITLEFNSAISLDEFYVWNHSNNGGAGAPANGVASFTLTFFDGPMGGGSQIGVPFNATASAAPATGTYGAEIFNFGSAYTGVRSVVFDLNNKQGGLTTGFVAVREIAFNEAAIPEPSSTAFLGSLSLLALLHRRR